MLSRRPLTSTLSPLTRTKRWTSRKKFSMSKNEPLKTNEKGIVGKPAEPTAAPGGSVAAEACVAGAGAGAEPLDEDDDDVPPLLLAALAVFAGVDGVEATGPCPPPPDTFSERKSMRALCAAL